MSLSRRPSLGAILLLGLLVFALVAGEGGEEDGDQRQGGGRDADEPMRSPLPGEVVPFLYVVDGDTIKVRFDGEDESVRLIGVDTPEVDPSIGVECFGSNASKFTERLLGGVEQVRIVFDAERRDRYDRLLAYVYAGPKERFVNAALVRRGFAETLTIAPNDRFAVRFDRLEEAAARAGRGLWGAC